MKYFYDIDILNSNKYFISASFFAFVLFYYLEYMSGGVIGSIASFFLFSLFLLLILSNHSLSILVLVILVVSIPEFPRDILISYDDFQNSGLKQYNTLASIKFGPATLILYLVLMLAFYSLIIRIKVNYLSIVFLLLLLSLSVFSVLYEFFITNIPIKIGLLMTSVKFLFVMYAGYIMGITLFHYHRFNSFSLMFGSLYFSILVVSIRAILYLVNDFVFSKELSFDIQVKPLLAIPAILFFVYQKKFIINGLRNVLVFSFFTVSRGEIILIFIVSILSSVFSKLFFRKVIVKIIVLIPLMVMVVFTFNSTLIDFFLWKFSQLSILGGENTSDSAVVRTTELSNILCLQSGSLFQFFFGKGLSGVYDFSCVPLPGEIVLDLKSFSQDQLDAGLYYTVHTFIGSILLKFGIFGLLLYILFPMYVVFFKVKNLFLEKNQKIALSLLLLVSLYFLHSRIEYQLIFGIFIGIIFASKSHICMENRIS
ncbi:hypothetical protein P0F20_003414, partial [Vibrio metschnikovii]|nr:hypothetical protein [Vibrio metschnikovii]